VGNCAGVIGSIIADLGVLFDTRTVTSLFKFLWLSSYPTIAKPTKSPRFAGRGAAADGTAGDTAGRSARADGAAADLPHASQKSASGASAAPQFSQKRDLFVMYHPPGIFGYFQLDVEVSSLRHNSEFRTEQIRGLTTTAAQFHYTAQSYRGQTPSNFQSPTLRRSLS
jgi:hypothetical protein